jgi:hypothetical protein
MPTYQFYEVPGTLIGILSVLGFWAVLLGVWLIVTMFAATLWAIILTPFVAPLVLCVYLLQIILSLAMNHFPWFVVLVLTAYIVAIRDWTSSKQEPRHNTMPDSDRLDQPEKKGKKKQKAKEEQVQSRRRCLVDFSNVIIHQCLYLAIQQSSLSFLFGR